MTNTDLSTKYFEWLYRLVCNKTDPYRKLLLYLFDTDFTFTIDLDENRAEDGMDLRCQFGDKRRYSTSMIDRNFGGQPCSVLEMMVALAVRCEINITADTEMGDRTGKWFWDMIQNMGLENMTDEHFNLEFVATTVSMVLNHEYERNGNGGLFSIKTNRHDMRSAEIWYQMCWYLDDIL